MKDITKPARPYEGNKNAYDYAAWNYLYINTRALQFIPLTYVGQPCMGVEIWGGSKLLRMT